MRKNIIYPLDIISAGLLRRQHLFAMVVSIIYLPTAAWADMDYKCLNDCMNAGETTTICMPKCSYVADNKTLKDEKKKNPYNQFSDVETAEVVKKYEEAAKAKKPLDYNCMPQCLKNDMQYQFCEEKCKKESSSIIK